MSTLSFLFGSGNTVDPRKEGLPLFGIGYADFNQQTSLRVIDSNFNIVGSPWGAIFNTTVGYSSGMHADAMWGYGGGSSQDMGNWRGSLSTEGYSSYSQWIRSMHQHDQYPMGMYVDLSPEGMFNGQTLHGFSNTKTLRGRFLINQILPEGCRPRRYFQMQSNTFRECPNMGSLLNGIDSVDLSTFRTLNGYTIGQGSAGYNEKTKTLVTLHYSGTAIQINRFVSTVDLNTCVSLGSFFAAATVTSATGTRTGSDNSGDTVVIVGDNGYVAVNYRSSNTQYADLINPDNTYSNGYFTSISNTTSYGTDQGAPYYNKMQLTWDGKWAAAYTAYYYYGNGLSCYVHSTEDPRRHFKINNTSSGSYGCAFLPLGKSGFMFALGENTDSSPVYMNVYNFSNTARSGTGSTTYSNQGSDGNVATANGGALNASTYNYNNLHGGYGSTCYPIFFTVNQWPTLVANAVK